MQDSRWELRLWETEADLKYAMCQRYETADIGEAIATPALLV